MKISSNFHLRSVEDVDCIFRREMSSLTVVQELRQNGECVDPR